MSADIMVFIDKKLMLNSKEWQSLISTYDFDFLFPSKFDVYGMSGWLPCKYRGEDSGFEYYFECLEDTMFSVDSNPELMGKDTCVSFSSPFKQENLASAMIASSVLVKHCEGVYWMMDDFVSGEDSIQMAREMQETGKNGFLHNLVKRCLST